MKKFIKILSISFITLLFFNSCNINCVEGTGAEVRKSIQIADFTELELDNNVQVYLSQGNTQQIEVLGQENLIPLLNTKVKGDKWVIEFDDCIESSASFEVYVTVPKLTKIVVDGSGSIKSENSFKGEIMEIELNGSGNLWLDLQVKELETELNGSGDVQLKGSTKQHDIYLDGSGDIMADQMTSDVVDIKVNGSGDVQVDVSYEINVKVNGSGDVYYKGKVKKISSDINGSGNLHQL